MVCLFCLRAKSWSRVFIDQGSSRYPQVFRQQNKFPTISKHVLVKTLTGKFLLLRLRSCHMLTNRFRLRWSSSRWTDTFLFRLASRRSHSSSTSLKLSITMANACTDVSVIVYLTCQHTRSNTNIFFPSFTCTGMRVMLLSHGLHVFADVWGNTPSVFSLSFSLCVCNTHTHTHTYTNTDHFGLCDELSDQVLHASCPAVRLEINLNVGLIQGKICPVHIGRNQKHDQKLQRWERKIWHFDCMRKITGVTHKSLQNFAF